MSLNYEEILEKVKPIVLEAGKFIKEAFDSREIINKTVEIKDGNSADLVTEVDKKVEQSLNKKLKELFPTFLFVGEETVSASPTKKCNITDQPTWVIDPVDGTTNFVHGFPFVCISVGLVVKKDPVMGIIYNPVLNNFYSGIKGKGSFVDGKKLPLIKNTPLKSLKESMIFTEYGADRNPDSVDNKLTNIKNIITTPIHAIRSMGSCAMNMCYVARGSADLYYEIGVHAWDVAAGVVILREAGGAIINWKRDDNIGKDVMVADEPYDICRRHIFCIRGVIEGKEHQSKLLQEIRDKLIDFPIESE